MTDLPVPPPLPATQRPAHVLVAEDDAAAANVLETLLGRVGYRVTVIADGAAILRTIEAGPTPDILLLDWMLPEVSGLEICRRVRERWDEVTLPILMVTAKTDAESISAAFEAGASDYLTKPFLGAELRARIAAHLRVRQLVEERLRMEEHLMEREKLSSLGLLVSGVAHELNNPLGGISGYAQLLLEVEDVPQKRDGLSRILHEVQRCNRIVTELLSFSRRHAPERARVDVGATLRGTVALHEHQLRSSGVGARLHIEPDLPPVHGDAHQLQQVFLNILVNAQQALRQSGGVLRVTAHRAASSTHAECVAVNFYNDGPPIPPDVLPRIFEPLFTTKPKDEGTGLGLAISRRIVREHGGEIDVDTGPEGTTFRVLLPADGVNG